MDEDDILELVVYSWLTLEVEKGRCDLTFDVKLGIVRKQTLPQNIMIAIQTYF